MFVNYYPMHLPNILHKCKWYLTDGHTDGLTTGVGWVTTTVPPGKTLFYFVTSLEPYRQTDRQTDRQIDRQTD